MILTQNNLKITGKMNLNKFLFIFCVLVFSKSFAQNKYPKAFVIDNDTVFIFSFHQAKQLAVINEDKKKFEELNNTCKKEIVQKDSIIKIQEEKLLNSEKIISKNTSIIKEKENQIFLKEKNNKSLKLEIKKQVRHKWIAIVSGITAFATINYIYIKK